jgi:asparagine synthase (glutamine-hydrolysing)
MCGLLGVFGKFDEKEYENHVRNIDDLIFRRGPDQVNSIKNDSFYGLHSRLIIQGDILDGVQPFEYKNIVVLFNGNLYNKFAIKKELEGSGYKISGASDTEVVAVALHSWGVSAFEKFNGFFSIALYDKSKKELTLARDKHGQKPIYYSSTSKAIYFGSTENMIPEACRGKIRSESYIDFITYGFVPAPFTMFENMHLLEPATYMIFRTYESVIKGFNKIRYWRPEITDDITNIDDAHDALSFELKHAVYDGLQADTNVACLYSGGVDSSLLFSYARDINKEIYTITADFGADDDAAERALPLISAYKHDNYVIKRINSKDVSQSLLDVGRICESPFDDTSVIPCNMVFSAVKKEGYRVAITGDGADELFCGYQSFSNLNRIKTILDPRFDTARRGIRSIFGYIPDKYKTANFNRYFMNEKDLLTDLSCNGFKKREWGEGINSDYDPFHHIETLMSDFSGLDVISKHRMLNLTFKLPNQMLYKIDRTSMFNSVEARPVFLNDRIVNCALSIGSKLMLQNGTKGILKKMCSNKLPTKEWSLPKTGFGWKTNNYTDIFDSKDTNLLYDKAGIQADILLKNRKISIKRGYYGLFSLATWVRKNSI